MFYLIEQLKPPQNQSECTFECLQKANQKKLEQLLTAFASHLLVSWQMDSSAAPQSQSVEPLSHRQDDSHLQPTTKANKTF